MKHLESIYFNKKLHNELTYFNEEHSPCHGIENVSIIVHKKKIKKKNKMFAQQPTIVFLLSGFRIYSKKTARKHSSMPQLNKRTKLVQPRTTSFVAISKSKDHPFNSKYVVNLVSQQRFTISSNPFNYTNQTKALKIYRCQLSSVEDSCCCSCNSDAMFEVMKSLYDCYKKKNCDDCNCILCGHQHREERRLGELRKSLGVVALEATPSAKQRKEQRKKAEKILQKKSPEEKERILRDMVKAKQPLPEGKTPSEKTLIKKIRAELGLPPEPKTAAEKARMRKAEAAGIITPLEGKTPEQKEKILKALRAMGILLPEGRTPSEKKLITKVKAEAGMPAGIPSERLRKARAAGLITPLEGKTAEQKEKVLRGLAMEGLPLPEGRTASEKKLIDKVRKDLGLPPEPKTNAMKDKYARAANMGILHPLEGKTPKEKENILQGLHDLGIPLPEGRTASEKALIAKVKTGPHAVSAVLAPSERMRQAKAAGFLTPLEGKTPEEKEKNLRGLAMHGIPLPEGKTPSEKKLIDKIRAELGLPPEAMTPEIKAKHEKAAKAGFLQPLEGKTPAEKEKILQGLHNLGIPLPEGRTSSEKSLIAKIKTRPRVLSPSEKKLKAKAVGLVTPLEGKSAAEKEKILKGLAMAGIPLPEGKTPSEKNLIDKIRAELGLPPEPKTAAMRDKHAKAADAGIMLPLEGKSPKEKEKNLRGLHDMGIPLPEGRTPSEKALIAKVMAGPPPGFAKMSPSEKMRRVKAAGLLTPLEGKTPEQKENILRGLAMHGISLPEGKTPSEKKIIDKIRAELGLPPEPTTPEMKAKHAKAAQAGLLQPLEGKTPAEKENILQGLHDLGIPLPEGRTPSERSLIAKVKARLPKVPLSEQQRIAKAAGLLSPLVGKTPAEKENILKALAMKGNPLPEGKTPSEKKLIDKIRDELGLPPEPKTQAMRDQYAKAAEAGLLQPLEGKSSKEKEKILKGLADMAIPLPVGRTPSEKALIAKVKGKVPASITTEKIRKAKAAGLLTPLTGKTPKQKEKILRGLANAGLPLPEGRTPSEKALINKIKKELGIPEKTQSEKLRKAQAAGLLTPLEGKTPAQKEKILRGRAAAGLPLPIGRTPSERALIQKIKDDTGYVTPSPSERFRKAKAAGLITPLKEKTPSMKEKILRNMLAAGVPIPEGETPSEKEMIKRLTAEYPKALSEKMKQAKTAGLLTPLQGKTPEQKKKILKNLFKAGLPLPEPKTASERDLIDKIRQEAGLPPEPKTPSLKEKYRKAQAAGIITPLEGKNLAEKEKILQRLHDAGIPLPEGRTPSEKSMIKRIKSMSAHKTSSEKLKAAKTAGLLTPLEGKTPAQKEKILRGLAKAGIPLPKGKTPSEKKLVDKIQKEMGFPPTPKTPSSRKKMPEAHAAGMITSLEGKTPAQKEKILSASADAGIPLPEGKRPSEKALITKVKTETKPPKTHSEKLRRAKAAGLLTPLAGKTPKEKEKIMRELAAQSLPLPETKTPSEKKLAAKIRKELGLPPEPKTPSMKETHEKAAAAGVLVPLEGLSPAEKERILKAQADYGLPLPEGRTSSEKALIAKIKAAQKPVKVPSKKIQKAKVAGLLTPLKGKTPDEKEKVLRGLVEAGLPLPEGKTASEKSLVNRIRTEFGKPPPATTPSEKAIVRKAKADGLFTPLTGKTPAQKEKILKGLAEAGLPLPVGKTSSEKELIKKIRAEAGLPPLPTPSERIGKIKKKDRKIGVTSEKLAKQLAKGIGAEEFQDVIKSTTCDRGCGCDKKKIRFKHSYVKIRVTSPDISALCPCPGECIPGVKSGAFVDNEGIKVTVGSAVGVPSYSREDIDSKYLKVNIHGKVYTKHGEVYTSNKKPRDRKICTLFDHTYKRDRLSNNIYEAGSISDKVDHIINTTSSESHSSILTAHGLPSNDTENDKSFVYFSTPPYEGRAGELKRFLETYKHYESSGDIYNEPVLKDYMIMDNSSRDSFDSILVLKSETSLSLSTSSNESMDTISVMSYANSSATSNSTHYFGYQLSNDLFSNSFTEESDFSTNRTVYDTDGTIKSDSDSFIEESIVSEERVLRKRTREIKSLYKQNEYQVFRMSQAQPNPLHEKKSKNNQKLKNGEPIVVINHLNSERDIKTMVDELLSKNEFSGASSIFVVVPSDDNDTGNYSDGHNSTICILEMSQNPVKWKAATNPVEQDKPQRRNSSTAQGVRISAKGKKFFIEGLPTTVLSFHNKETMFDYQDQKTKDHKKEKTKNKLCQITTPNEIVQRVEQRSHVVSTDTTADRPCCCPPKQTQYSDFSSNDRYVANVTSKQITPLLVNHGKWDDCPTCLHPPLVEECACSGSKKPKNFKPTCPCGWHQPRTLMELGFKNPCRQAGQMVTDGGTTESSHAIPHRYLGPMQLIGPAGESMQIETGETYTQAGTKQTRFSSTIGTSTNPELDCGCKRGKRTKKIICERPELEPEATSLPEPEQQPLPQWISPNDFEWVDEREIKRIKSILTERFSGFKMHQKKRPPPDLQEENEYTLDDAIRYYASMKPELFRDIILEQQLFQLVKRDHERQELEMKEKTGKERQEGKKGNSKLDSEFPPKIMPPPLPPSPASPLLPPVTEPTPSEVAPSESQEAEGPLRGLNFKMGGKGSGSPGLASIRCFDLLQESFTTW